LTSAWAHFGENPDSEADFKVQVLPFNIVIPNPNVMTYLPVAIVSVAYAASLTATGGVTPYTWTVSSGALPPGLTLGASTGAINGTPTAVGTYPFVATAKDAVGQTASAAYAIQVVAASATPAPPAFILPTATKNVPYLSSVAFAASGPYMVTEGVVPAGLSVSATGVLSGVPTGVGMFNFLVAGPFNAKAAFTLVVKDASTLSLSPISGSPWLPEGMVGQPYSTLFAATGGLAPYQFLVSGGLLPPGLVLQAPTGLLQGTPTQEGTYLMVVAVKDSQSPSAFASLPVWLKINPVVSSPIQPTPPTEPPAAGAGFSRASQVGTVVRVVEKSKRKKSRACLFTTADSSGTSRGSAAVPIGLALLAILAMACGCKRLGRLRVPPRNVPV
jgi:hypothetical protein